MNTKHIKSQIEEVCDWLETHPESETVQVPIRFIDEVEDLVNTYVELKEQCDKYIPIKPSHDRDMNIEEITNRLEEGYYETQNNRRGYTCFKNDTARALGMENHPKWTYLFEMAWDYGHSSGYNEVWIYMLDLMELVK